MRQIKEQLIETLPIFFFPLGRGRWVERGREEERETFFFFKIFLIYLREREKKKHTHTQAREGAEGDADSPPRRESDPKEDPGIMT